MAEKLRFRDPDLAKRIAKKIHEITPEKETVKLCHVCGTHEWTITHFGIRSLLPANVEVIACPGCPVCIVPASEIDEAVQLALKGVTVTCFGDVLRVPGSRTSLLEAKAEGADVRVVYGVSDAVKMAKNEAELAKISIRTHRRNSNEEGKALEKEGVSEDEVKILQEKIQDLTKHYIDKIEKLLEEKEKDISTL